MTKAIFLEIYKDELKSRYEWANEDSRLSKFMDVVRGCLDGVRRDWLVNGEAVVASWEAIGGKGKPTLKALRALP